jgi:guanine deaminase
MHREFLNQAIEVAKSNVNSGQGGPFGAIIVKDDCVVSSSGNRVTSTLDPTAHAEILAIRQACQKLGHFQLTDCVLYTSCEPCPMCLGAIYWARLKKVYFACSREDAAAANFDDSYIYQEIAICPSKRGIVMQQIGLQSSNEPFNLWNKLSDKVRY